MRRLASRTRPSQLGRIILRRLFDTASHKPRPHIWLPELKENQKTEPAAKPLN